MAQCFSVVVADIDKMTSEVALRAKRLNSIFVKLYGTSYLKDVHKLVKYYHPDINLKKDAWVWHFWKDQWEFHGPGNFYEGSLNAHGAYEARAQGWMLWLQKQHPEIDMEKQLEKIDELALYL